MNCQHLQTNKIKYYKKNNIHKCEKCGLIINKRSPKDNYNDYYKKDSGGRFTFFTEQIVKLFRFTRAIQIKFLCSRAKSILDIGSGRGYMLYFLKKYFSYSIAMGTQISEPARIFSQKKLLLDICGKDLLDIEFKNKFDVITIYHVLEHIQNPEEYIKKIANIINKNGYFVIQVPNYKSWTNFIAHDYWLALDPENHRFFFTPNSLSKLIKKYNFKIIYYNSFSLEYSVFTSTQSIINKITNSQNIFFKFLQSPQFSSKIILHIFLFIFLTPISLFINIFLYFSKYGENINIIARKYDL